MRIHHFFLNFYIVSDMILYNAIGVGYMPWRINADKNALPVGGAFFFDSEEQALWPLVIKSSGNY